MAQQQDLFAWIEPHADGQGMTLTGDDGTVYRLRREPDGPISVTIDGDPVGTVERRGSLCGWYCPVAGQAGITASLTMAAVNMTLAYRAVCSRPVEPNGAQA